MSKIFLIIGANGYLGSYLIRAVKEKTGDTVMATARRHLEPDPGTAESWISCDITDRKAVDELAAHMKAIGEEYYVIVCAACHQPEAVEKNPRLAWDINVTALSYLLNRLENVKDLYYPSTDSVYGQSVGQQRFVEEDRPAPVNTYGRQKVVAESLVLGYGYHVVRFPFLIGPSLAPGKEHFYDRIVTSLTNGQPVEMFADSYRSSLDFATAAGCMIDLMTCGKQVPAIVNICGDDDLSKYDIGKMIAGKLGAAQELIRPVFFHSDQGIFNVKRAQSTLMDNTRMKDLLGLRQVKISV